MTSNSHMCPGAWSMAMIAIDAELSRHQAGIVCHEV